MSILKSPTKRPGKCIVIERLPSKLGEMKAALAVIFLVVFAVFSVALKTELRRDKSPIAALKINSQMRDFSLPDTNGKAVKLSEMMRDKKIVLVNFWASWCGPCRVEMPSFEKLYNEEKNNGFIILAISEDDQRPKLDQYLKQRPVSFPVLIDVDGALAKQLKVQSLPTTVLVEHDGKIREVHEGVQPYLQYSVQAALHSPK
jgi:peroxiredoxin